MTKYLVTVEEVTEVDGERYPRNKTVYTQEKEGEIVEAVIRAVNGIPPNEQ